MPSSHQVLSVSVLVLVLASSIPQGRRCGTIKFAQAAQVGALTNCTAHCTNIQAPGKTHTTKACVPIALWSLYQPTPGYCYLHLILVFSSQSRDKGGQGLLVSLAVCSQPSGNSEPDPRAKWDPFNQEGGGKGRIHFVPNRITSHGP